MTSAGVTARHLEAADRAVWDGLWQGYLDFYEVELPPGVSDRTWERLLHPQFDMHGLLAHDGEGRAIGLCNYLFHPSTWSLQPYCYLEDLYVAEGARGRGGGRALIEMVYAAADARGCERVYWVTHDTNTAARSLYDKVGRLRPFVQYAR
ncbi:GNAT family N-acetyltransferase [Lutibaculum baratangense]|uniref:GNAT family acetyltransferase n=1 Tax=Lutibaculum baratangense AMV1 TaxID=631454 RepID=V4TL61_9HYPH|nr:GNAT family N-acetyltransferase [Lutibaculum baratangense]ESR26558.1 GNAT family acetyltransferase [Lutibaculum baratangense AMV1]